MSEMVEVTEMHDIQEQRMEIPETMDLSESMELAEMPDLSEIEENSSHQMGRKRQRSGSATPEEQSMVQNIMKQSHNNAHEYPEEQHNSGEDRAALLLRVYLKMKLGEYNLYYQFPLQF